MQQKHLIEARLRFSRAKAELIIAKAELQALDERMFRCTTSEIDDNIFDLEKSIKKLDMHLAT